MLQAHGARVLRGAPLRGALGYACRNRCRALSAGAGAGAEENPVTLTSRSCTVHVLGTMHIASASAAAAEALIEREHAAGRLAAVFLELDEDRYRRLREVSAAKRPDESLLQHALSILSRPGRGPVASLFELGLSSIYRALHKLGFASGVEFTTAIAAADRLGGVPLVLGDQDIKITLARIADALPRDFSIAKAVEFIATPAKAQVEGQVERDLREVFREMTAGNFDGAQKKLERLIDRDTARKLVAPMRNLAPNMTAAILDERDGVMAANLLREAHKHPGKSVVAVVGMAHVDGIVSRWNVIAD